MILTNKRVGFHSINAISNVIYLLQSFRSAPVERDTLTDDRIIALLLVP